MLKQRTHDGGVLTHQEVIGYRLFRKNGDHYTKPPKEECCAVVVLQSNGTLGAVPIDHVLNWTELPTQIPAKV